MGDPDAELDKSRIVQAAKLRGASEFIEDLPDGYDTVLENRLFARGTESFCTFGWRSLVFSRRRVGMLLVFLGDRCKGAFSCLILIRGCDEGLIFRGGVGGMSLTG